MRHSSIAAGTLLALMGASLPSQTTQSATSTGQSACYVPGSGTVYRIKAAGAPAQCSPGHTEFQLSAIGGAKPISGPTGPAGGDLGGDYPNPVVVGIQGHPVANFAPKEGQLMLFTGGYWQGISPGVQTLPTNSAGAITLGAASGLLVEAGPGSFPIPASGAGMRMMWFAPRAAFRAGTVSTNYWDDANVGQSSVAFGTDTKASGANSAAFGNVTWATGANSFAVGSGSHATGNTSVALGLSASASGWKSVALGYNAVAGLEGSVAIGNSVSSTGVNAIALGSSALAAHTGSIVLGDASSQNYVTSPANNYFVVRAQGIWLGTGNSPTATAGRFIETSTGAYLTTSGVWTNVSDVNKKHDFKQVDGEEVLEKLSAMPVSTWSYKADSSKIRHMGPTAQDFRAAFGLGDTDKAIGTIDADGVSLAAVKALIQRTTELRAENAELRSELAEIQRRLTELQTTKP